MVTAHESSSLLMDYQLHLPQFEGPLDVLLRLIERSQLEITDLSLMRVTEQFLTYVRALDVMAPTHVVAEFAAVGARLTLLKSRSLLPRPPAEEIEEDPGDLARQLAEYRRCKQMASQLSERLASGAGSFGPETTRTAWHDPQPARLAHYEPSVLIRLLRRRLSVLPRPSALFRQRSVVTLPQMVDRILSFVRGDSSLTFQTVLNTCHDRSEAATAFLALLVLHRRQVISADQRELFGEIRLMHLAEPTGIDRDSAIRDADDAFMYETADEELLAGVNA